MNFNDAKQADMNQMNVMSGAAMRPPSYPGGAIGAELIRSEGRCGCDVERLTTADGYVKFVIADDLCRMDEAVELIRELKEISIALASDRLSKKAEAFLAKVSE